MASHPARALVALWALMAAAAPAWAVEAERARVAAERMALEQRFQAAEQACAGRFAVNACLDDVRAQRRAALAPLREAELRLDEGERRRRAEERREQVARKQEALAMRMPAASAPAADAVLPPGLPAVAAPAPVPASAAAAASAPSRPPVHDRRAAAAQSAAEAARRAAELRRSSEKAAAAEARVRERRAEQRERLQRHGRQPDTLPRPASTASQPAR